MRKPVQHVASNSVLTVLEGVAPYFPEEWPAVLPSRADPVLRPLAVGIDQALVDRIVPPAGVSAEEAGQHVRRALGYLVRSYSYLRAVSVAGAMRHDIDMRPVQPVTSEQAEFARSRLPGYVKPQSPATKMSSTHEVEVIDMQIESLKITLPLKPAQLRQVGETVKTVDLQLDLGDGKPFVVGFSGKNYRRALRQVEELQAGGSEVVVLLQGKLVMGHRIESAGLSVQVKTPKAG